MKKKQTKPTILSPFQKSVNNWELITSIQSSLNKYLLSPHIITNIEPEEINQRAGKASTEDILKISKSISKILEHLKAEQKTHQQIKNNSILTQQKLEQHDAIVRNLERNFSDRTKGLVEENKILKESNDRMKKILNEYEDNSKQVLDLIKNQNQELKSKITAFEEEKMKFLKLVAELQDKIEKKQQLIAKYLNSFEREENKESVGEKMKQLQGIRMKYRKNKQIGNEQKTEMKEEEEIDVFLRLIWNVNASSSVLSYLNPHQICNISSLNKAIRLIVMKSKYCNLQLCKSIVAVKNKKINFYHQHITYFQKLSNKIPEQILQTTYFQTSILKQAIGSQILAILNSSALIFEGKFIDQIEGEQLFSGLENDYKPEKIKMNIRCKQAFYLDVDEEIIAEFFEQKKTEKQKIIKEVELMYKKITGTLQLYGADAETTALFIRNILKNFSKVFVLSKNLYSQARNLQQLNTFLLGELSTWDKMQIDKKHKIQDLQAELQAQKKLKLFFTDKSIKSQQKALNQQNLKLIYEMKFTKLQQLMNSACAEKDELQKKNETFFKNNKSLILQNKEFKKMYEQGKEKYNKIIEELTVVKETIVRMNIL